MSPRELILLNPYRLPAQNPLMLGNEDVASFLNGYSVLWHPAALAGATGPPRVGSPYDHEQPSAGQVFAVPESPPLILPDDWDQRVRDAGAVAFRATPDRAATVENLKRTLQGASEGPQLAALLDLEPVKVAAFFGIGFGHGMVETLFEAMSHENVLAAAEFWQDIQAAVAALCDADPEAYRRPLQAAADRLLAAREVLYPVTIHLLDLCLLDDQRLGESLPASFGQGMPLNVISSAVLLERLAREHPEQLAALRERLREEKAEICGGCYLEREDALLPLESQLWNFRKGLAVSKELLDQEIRVFARKRFAAYPQLPLVLNSVGLRQAVLVPFDEAVLPSYRVTVVNWPSPDGKQVTAFTRPPYQADSPQTFFHWAHYLNKTIAQDHAATLALLHGGKPAGPWYLDLLELSRFAPVFGQWTTLSRYLNEVMAGEYTSAGSADDFHGDYLSDRTNAHSDQPVSWFARHIRLRRRLDTVWTLAALHRGLAGRADDLRLDTRLVNLDDRFETGSLEDAEFLKSLSEVEREAAEALSERLLARAAASNPGYLLLNPCSFTRRVVLELDNFAALLPTTGQVKACQVDGGKGQLVVEVPALGFAWIPRPSPGAADMPLPRARMRLADSKTVRNEFFEAEIDPATGGLRGLRDHRTRVNRIGQQLVFNPGSTMRAKEVKVTSGGPALGEVISEGAIFDEQEQVLALYRQRYRAWLGRPMLELRIEIYPQQSPQGYPWHAYYGARFAWRDERAALLRGVNGTGFVTSHTRPETPDYLELRLGRQSTVLFPGGLPFHQRHGGRMLDVLLVPEGETARVFEIGLGIDREYPMQTALGMVTPITVVPTTKGPPHVGSAGWLFHLDAPNLMLTSLRPAAEGADAVVARLVECNQHSGSAELRCVRDPRRAVLLDAQGITQMEAQTSGDAVFFDVSASDLVHLRVEFE
jgi:alpha-mannosidase